MKQYDNKMKFVLFKNEKKNPLKKEHEKWPDYSGTGELDDGTEVELGAWIRESKNTGKKFLSGVFRYTDPKRQQQQNQRSFEQQEEEDNSNIF